MMPDTICTLLNVFGLTNYEFTTNCFEHRYIIHLKHGEFEWTIKRRYKQFRQLHEQLILFKARLRIPYPTKRYNNYLRVRSMYLQIEHRADSFTEQMIVARNYVIPT